jgi:hypothetical protein
MRKDKIFQNFLNHPKLVAEYGVLEEHPENLRIRDGLRSPNKVVRAIAFLVDSLESDSTTSDSQLYTQITQLLTNNV